jgi:hypothetical protein
MIGASERTWLLAIGVVTCGVLGLTTARGSWSFAVALLVLVAVVFAILARARRTRSRPAITSGLVAGGAVELLLGGYLLVELASASELDHAAGVRRRAGHPVARDLLRRPRPRARHRDVHRRGPRDEWALEGVSVRRIRRDH